MEQYQKELGRVLYVIYGCTWKILQQTIRALVLVLVVLVLFNECIEDVENKNAFNLHAL